MAEIQKIIGQVAIFMICAQAITHFRPKEAYGKYLRLLLGVMILVQIFQPVYGLFFGTEKGDSQVSLEMFQEKLDTSMEEAAEQAIL